MNSCVVATPLGNLQVEYSTHEITGIDFVATPAGKACDGPVIIRKLTRQLEQYFNQANFKFDLPLKLEGTEFQQRVWAELRRIPPGEVRTYGELADQLSSSARAVGNACRANPITLVVPCHRVVAKNGAGGYMGQRDGEKLDIKRRLLRHEGLEI